MSRFGRPTWRNGFSQAMILPTNKDSRIFLRLCRAQATKATSPNQNYVMMHLQHLDQRSSLMLFTGNLLGSRVLHIFGKEMRHHCLLYGPDATSSTQGSSVPFLNAWSCPFRVMKSCQATRTLSPQAQSSSPRKHWPSRYLGTTYGRCSNSHRRFSRSIRNET